jgi:hypothetical protein
MQQLKPLIKFVAAGGAPEAFMFQGSGSFCTKECVPVGLRTKRPQIYTVIDKLFCSKSELTV